MTDQALAVLRLLCEGEGGLIEAVRTYPHPYRFKVRHPSVIGEKEVTLAVVDQLVRANVIAAQTPNGTKPLQQNVYALDRYDYVITDAGKALLARVEEERQRARKNKTDARKDLDLMNQEGNGD